MARTVARRVDGCRTPHMPSAHGSPASYRDVVLGRYRFALRPGWIVLHVLTVSMSVTMVLLGLWQLNVSEAKHFNVRNFGYSLQWWAFTAFALFMWWRILRDAAQRGGTLAESAPPPSADREAGSGQPAGDEEPAPVAYRRYVMPTAVQPSSDPVHTAYNEYLAALAARDKADEAAADDAQHRR